MLLKDSEFACDTPQSQAIQKLNDFINRTPSPQLTYFDPGKPVVLKTYALQFGLGETLLQDGEPVDFASKSLTRAEVKYAQIEKEMLSILFGCKKFPQYLYGREVNDHTDHKPGSTNCEHPLTQVFATYLPEGMDVHVHTVISSLRFSGRRMEEARSATQADPQMKVLMSVTQYAWPECRKKSVSHVLEFWKS